MKKIVATLALALNIVFGYAQKEILVEKSIIVTDSTPRTGSRSNQKIITVQLKGDKATEQKITLQIDGNKIMLNGKDVINMDDVNVTIGENKIMFNNGRGRVMEIPNFPMDKLRGLELQIEGMSRGREKMDIAREKMQRKFGELNSKINTMNNKPLLGIAMEKVATGVKITDVNEGTAAAKAGLQKGDIITKLNGTAITTELDISKLINDSKVDDKVTIDYTRNDKRNTTIATLQKRNEDINFNFNGEFDGADFPKYGRVFEMPENENFEFKIDGDMPNVGMFKGFGNTNNQPKLGATLKETENGVGLTITDIEKNSVAEKAGLQKGDVVITVNEIEVNDVKAIKDALRNNKSKPNIFIYKRKDKIIQTIISFPRELKEVAL